MARSQSPNALREVVKRYPRLQGLQEDLAWSHDFAPHFDLPPQVRRMTQHAFCELLNNAIEHSGGTQVTVSMRQTPEHIQLLVSDNGCGLFEKLHRDFGLGDPALAMLELSKGKLTSQPNLHGGHGLFFVARLADVFDLHANAEAFKRRDWEGNGWLSGRPVDHRGTSVFAAIALDTTRTLRTVLQAHSLQGTGMTFDRTSIPLRLAAKPGTAFDSRAEARRIASRTEQFRRVDVDFEGIEEIGYSFADELFRVLPSQQQGVQMVPLNMSLNIALMVESVSATH